MLNIDLEQVEDVQDFKRLAPGGYVCRIMTVKDIAEKEYLKIEYDITEGEFKDYYVELFGNKNFWGGSFIKSYKEKALPFFKGFITAVEKSNNGYKWDNDETKLERKLVGLVLGEEEYQKNDGSVGKRLYVAAVRDINEIRKGNFAIPPLKVLKGTNSNQGAYNGDIAQTDDTDLPF